MLQVPPKHSLRGVSHKKSPLEKLDLVNPVIKILEEEMEIRKNLASSRGEGPN
jgi:hypothetical protein